MKFTAGATATFLTKSILWAYCGAHPQDVGQASPKVNANTLKQRLY